MHRPAAAALLIALSLLPARPAGAGEGAGPAPPPLLEPLDPVPLPGVRGRIDHMALAADGKRLFVAALGNGTVEAVDLASGAVTARAKDLEEPQGILLLPGEKEVAVACGGDGTVRFLDAATLAEKRRLSVGGDADNLRWDAAAERVVAAASGRLAWIDPATGKADSAVAVPGHPEGFALEDGGGRLFVNLPGDGCVGVVDRKERTLAARWRLGEAQANYPLALDGKRARVFTSCRRPARLLVLDAAAGKVLQSLEAVGDADDLFVEPASGRVFLVGGEGFVDVFLPGKDGAYAREARVATAGGARTGLLVPERRLLLVAAPARGGKDAALLRFRLPAAADAPPR